MSKCKTKAIQTDLGTFRYNQSYPGIIQAYSSIFKTLGNPDIFRTKNNIRTLAHSQHSYIQDLCIFRILAYSKSEAYSEPCQISSMKQFANGYDYFCKLILFSHYKLVALSSSWNKYEVVTPEVVKNYYM